MGFVFVMDNWFCIIERNLSVREYTLEQPRTAALICS